MAGRPGCGMLWLALASLEVVDFAAIAEDCVIVAARQAVSSRIATEAIIPAIGRWLRALWEHFFRGLRFINFFRTTANDQEAQSENNSPTEPSPVHERPRSILKATREEIVILPFKASLAIIGTTIVAWCLLAIFETFIMASVCFHETRVLLRSWEGST